MTLVLYSANVTEVTIHYFPKDELTTNKQCIFCHQQSQHDWRKSDHVLSMEIADFNNTDYDWFMN